MKPTAVEKTKKFAISIPIHKQQEEQQVIEQNAERKQEKAWFEQYLIPSERIVTYKNASERLKWKNDLFHQVFDQDYSTKQIALKTLQERNQIKQQKQVETSNPEIVFSFTSLGSLTYGEMSDVYPLYTVFQLLSKKNLMPPAGSGRFYDLGSGSGRIIIAAALLYPFEAYIGIELLHSLFSISVEVQEKFLSVLNDIPIIEQLPEITLEEDLAVFRNDSDWLKDSRDSKVRFHQGSIDFETLDENELALNSDFNWTKGSFIFINSTCFDSNLMEIISRLCQRLLPGTIVVTLTHMLLPISDCDCIHELRLEMNW
eukprot:gene5978-6425_t